MWNGWPFHVLLAGIKNTYIQPLWKPVPYKVKHAFKPTVAASIQDDPKGPHSWYSRPCAVSPATVDGLTAVTNRLEGK